MPIQDNLHGALLISAMDFILSFVIIGGIGVILSLFPLLNRIRTQKSEGALTEKHDQPAPTEPCSSTISPIPSTLIHTATTSGIHPGLSDQQLVLLLTVAAYEMLGEPVRIDKFRPLNAKDWSWSAHGRHDLQSHRLK